MRVMPLDRLLNYLRQSYERSVTRHAEEKEAGNRDESLILWGGAETTGALISNLTEDGTTLAALLVDCGTGHPPEVRVPALDRPAVGDVWRPVADGPLCDVLMVEAEGVVAAPEGGEAAAWFPMADFLGRHRLLLRVGALWRFRGSGALVAIKALGDSIAVEFVAGEGTAADQERERGPMMFRRNDFLKAAVREEPQRPSPLPSAP